MSGLMDAFSQVMGRQSGNIEYLQSKEVQDVLEEGLRDLYLRQPRDPLHYLGNWLVHYSRAQSQISKISQQEENKKDLIAKNWERQAEVEAQEIQISTHRETLTARKKNFLNQLEDSTDLEDNLQDLVNYVNHTFKLTGTYCGIMEKAKKQVNELEDDTAHIDEEAPEVVRFFVVSQDQEFLLDKQLTEEQAPVSHGIWKPQAEEDEEPVVGPLFIPDVIRETRLYYFKVPRLGCFYSVPITIKTLLQEQALAVRLGNLKLEDEDQKADDAYGELRILLSMDTLGQDVVLSEADRKEIQSLCEIFKQNWENAEHKALDYDVQVQAAELEAIHEKQSEINVFPDKEKIAGDDAVKQSEHGTPEAEKELRRSNAIMELWRTRLLENWELLQINAQRRIIRFPRVWQVAFYFFGIPREKITVKGTNQLDWKKARAYLDPVNFKTYLEHVTARGEKQIPVPAYAERNHLLNYLLTTNEEEIKAYSAVIWMLRQFLVHALQTRIADVQHRRKIFKAKQQERKELKQKEIARLERREAEWLVAFEKDPELDKEDFIEQWEQVEANHPIEIIDKTEPHTDGDVAWEEQEE